MIPASLEYVAPDSVAGVLSALADAGEDGKLLAGGQSLLPVLRLRLAYPSTLIDLGRVDDLRGVHEDGGSLVIGAMTRHCDVITDPLVARHAPLIAAATRTVADPAIRHRGTFGGSLAHADPAGDLPAVAVALDADFVMEGPAGRRTVPASEFFVDYLQTALSADELLVEVRVPKLEGWGVHYEKFQRVAQAWAIVGVAAAVRVENGTIAEARVGLTNMGTVPIRATSIEAALVGAAPEPAAVGAATALAAEGTAPPSDLSGAADYRAHLAPVLARRAVLAAAGSA
jgi:aerobic carbon-monoxide dehydrogenase medium subunit